jgi:hypothetical protein
MCSVDGRHAKGSVSVCVYALLNVWNDLKMVTRLVSQFRSESGRAPLSSLPLTRSGHRRVDICSITVTAFCLRQTDKHSVLSAQFQNHSKSIDRSSSVSFRHSFPRASVHSERLFSFLHLCCAQVQTLYFPTVGSECSDLISYTTPSHFACVTSLHARAYRMYQLNSVTNSQPLASIL